MQGTAIGKKTQEICIQNENTWRGSRVMLESSAIEKDLGVLVDNELKFPRHIETQALGAGKLDDDPNQLIQAPEEEEEFDILNDETFGDLAEYDWEDEHQRMAEELENSTYNRNETRDSGFVTIDKGNSSTVQEDLEQSISKLVVDDGDSKAFTVYGQPIPGAQRKSHLDELFGPNSPPGYMELESLNSGKNIWGSPSADNPFQKPVNNTLQALFASAKQAALRDFPGSFHDSKATHAPTPNLPLPAEAATLAEVEHNMMAREHHKPRMVTAEELERQLRGEPPLPSEPRPSYSVPVQIPPVGTAVAFRKQPTQVPLGMRPPDCRIPNGESSPINIVRPHAQSLPAYQGQDFPLVMDRSSSPSPSHIPPSMPPPGMLAQSPRLISPYSPAAVIMANRLFGNAMVRHPPPPTHVPPHNVASPFGSPSYGSPSAAVITPRAQVHPNLEQQSPPNRPHMTYQSGRPYGGHPMHPPHLQQGRNSHGGDRNHVDSFGYGDQRNHSNPPFSDRRDYNHSQRGPGQHGHFQRHHEHNVASYSDHEVDDDYAGLMTQKEKDWIIKIQLIQLQTDNPYLDDYYYTYFTMKKKAADWDKKQRSVERKNNEPELLIPSMIRIEPRIYTPAQFEGSLGRLTAASVHNPRQIIDVCRNVSPTSEDSSQKSVSKELRRYRQLLMDIEKGFNAILDVDDIEKKVLALPDENRLPMFEERLEKIQTVFDYFMQEESLKNFLPTLGVRKGRKLLARLMPLLDKVQLLSIVTVLLSHLRVLIRKDQDEEGLQVLMPPLARYIAQCDLEFLVHFATILQKHPEQNEEGISLLLRSSFGVSLLCCFITTGEVYFKNTPIDIDNQLKTQWTQFIEEFTESLQNISEEELAWPSVHQPLVGNHIDRFINNQLIGSVEDKLARLCKPRPCPEQQQEDAIVTKTVPAS